MNVFFEEPETTELVPIDWREIRREYFKVWADFPVITKPFGITLSQRQINSIGHMLVAMNLIDLAIDREPNQQTRLQLCESVLGWMAEKGDWYRLPQQFDQVRLTSLRNIIHRYNIESQFLTAAASVFRASECKRNSTTASDLIANLIEEGQSAAEMTIQILGSNTNPGLCKFLQRIMRIGTIVDTLLDAEDDFQQGILRMTPGQVFRWRLKFAIARQLPGLVFGFSDRSLLWRYCLSYTRADLTPLSFDVSRPP
jgi:hypothetical protein